MAIYSGRIQEGQEHVIGLGSGETTVTQLSILSAGGSGAPVPDLLIEVDALDAM